ncbi:hypothetical protein QYF36_013259 [Acer negundo]|nr:hypothetical protein QYF36_013259 [Acer negundo]
MLPPKLNHNDLHGLFSISRGHVVDAFGGFSRQIMLPETKYRKYFSCKDWIVTLHQDGTMSLLHPFIRKQIELPHVKTFTNLFRLSLSDMYESFIFKCVLSMSPSSTSDYTVMVIYELFLHSLAYCKPGDKNWTTVNSWEPAFLDVVYYKEKFYAINYFNNIQVCDVRSDNPTETRQLGNISDEVAELEPERLYMVESEGALLVVMVKIKSYSTYERLFWVFNVDFSTNTWTEIKDLDKRSLFLSQHSSMSVEISFDNYCKSNCIYFIEDCAESFLQARNEEEKELRVYNMQDGSAEKVYKMENRSIKRFSFDSYTHNHHIPLMWLEHSF